jgi:hypothetical protein
MKKSYIVKDYSDEFCTINWKEAIGDYYKRFKGRIINIVLNDSPIILYEKVYGKDILFYQSDYYSGDDRDKSQNFENLNLNIIAIDNKIISNSYFELDDFIIFTPKKEKLDFDIRDKIIFFQIELVNK